MMNMFSETWIIHFVFADWDHGHGCLSLDARLHNQVKSAHVWVTIIVCSWNIKKIGDNILVFFSTVLN